MSTFGLQVMNANNVLQVDETFLNDAFYLKKRVTLTRLSNNLNYYTYSEAFPSALSDGEVKVAAALVDTSLDIYLSLVKTNTSFAVIAVGNTSAPSSVEVDVFMFTAADRVTSESNYGLKVYNDNGALTFDSNLRYMRTTLVAVPVIPTAVIGLVYAGEVITENYSLPSGRRYAISSGSYRGRSALEVWAFPGDMDQFYYTTTYVFFGGYKLSQNSASYRYWCHDISQDYTEAYPWTYDYIFGFSNALIIDVTDY